MNMVMISKLLKFGRRQLHTIVSRDTIKPSSPTPSHLKTYNLSLLDQFAINAFVPVIALYPSSSSNMYRSYHEKTLELKNSLSQTLTRFYPFAGRMIKTDPTFVDCNDEGVMFIEATNTSSLSDFLQQSEHNDLDQLFPEDLIWFKSNYKKDENNSMIICPLAVQVSHFACGGVAVATSLSHKIGDANSSLHFIKHWAAVNHKNATSPIINPHFISYERRTGKVLTTSEYPLHSDYVTKTFSFSNTKINDLKTKVTTMTMDSKQPIVNPTRIEALTWLLYKCELAACNKTKSLAFKENIFLYPINLRSKLIEKLPETSIGNFLGHVMFPINDDHGDVMPDEFISELRKRKHKLQNIRNLETIFDQMSSDDTDNIKTVENKDSYYIFSSVCGFRMYDIDFGWGKPVKVTIFGGTTKNFTVLMDTRDGNGIEVQVSMEKEDMKILLNDAELLAFCC
ncbi:tabersonine-19-hydroxy-O-acetyltransferase-like [Rutidosis leptorrhynchoides]|uniref:tabersonine-19-hydroxy-O-acetyltransferase-like n=1 Tax=Rutidosis leptorrhynchoides TaxID=125765 RepID=UPI003A997516